ncbi:MAG: ATP-binding protein [Planctomycetota bacterium]
MNRLNDALEMLPIERATLLLCVAIELEPRLTALCAAASDEGLPYPTFALALKIFEDKSWNLIQPQRPLRYWHLLDVQRPADRTLTGSCLRADERIVNYVLGLPGIDARLDALCSPLAIDEQYAALASDQCDQVKRLVSHIDSSAQRGRVPIIHLTGTDSVAKQLVAQQVAAAFQRKLWRTETAQLSNHADVTLLSRLWTREALLGPAALYIDDDDDRGSDDRHAITRHWLKNTGGLIFVATQQTSPASSPDCISVEVNKPTPRRQRAAWQILLGEAAEETSRRLSGQFNLNLADIRLVTLQAEAAPVDAPSGEPKTLHPKHQELWRRCCETTRPSGLPSIQRIETVANWKDLVLPAGSVRIIEQIVSQVRQRSRVYDDWRFREKMSRGLGISVLFAGESGTGKTMAAEVIAGQLELDLYRVDLSAVVNKYIGETEKNLKQVFDAAEDGGAILFFDEADSLFGRRSEVKDSHDRYANLETNYLLQRMESYRGLAILATNMKKALDKAFLRRLRFIVDFPLPGREQRRQIWQRSFPTSDFLKDLDIDRLADLNLTGGNIHNISLNATFLAAETGDPRITMNQVLESARDEYRKLDRPINESVFESIANGGVAT